MIHPSKIQEIENEFGEPFGEILRGFAIQGESARSVAGILELPRRPVEAAWHQLRLPRRYNHKRRMPQRFANPKKMSDAARAWNRRKGRGLVTIDGETRLISEWAEAVGIKPVTLKLRIRRGWNPKQAITRPVRKRSKP